MEGLCLIPLLFELWMSEIHVLCGAGFRPSTVGPPFPHLGLFLLDQGSVSLFVCFLFLGGDRLISGGIVSSRIGSLSWLWLKTMYHNKMLSLPPP